MQHYDYTMAFLAGILGSAHCIGMCGGLVSAFFMRVAPGGRGVWPYLVYHGGRISVYMMIGMISGMVGLAVSATDSVGMMQSLLKVFAGLVVILLGFDILGVGPLRVQFSFLPVAALRSRFLAATEKGPLVGSVIGGMVNGLMPCALTMAVAIEASTSGGPLRGGLLMLAFGAGTLPSMLFVSALFGRLGANVRGKMLKAAALFVIALGISTVFQGVMHLLVIHG